MRVTDAMSYRLMQTQIKQINDRMIHLQEQAATGKKVNSVSDDPAAVRPILNYRSQITANEQFQNNAQTVLNNLGAAESQLSNIRDVFQSARQEAILGKNGTLDDSDKEQIATVISGLRDELMSISNSKSGKRYIFAGYQESTQPFARDANGKVTYSGDSQSQAVTIAPGEEIDQSVPGNEVFMGQTDSNGDGILDTNGPNLMQTLANVERALQGHEGEIYNLATGEYTADVPQAGDPSQPLTHNGEPINLTPLRTTDGKVVTIGDLSASDGNTYLKSGSTTFANLAQTALDKTVYMHADGSIAHFNDQGDPVLLDGGGNVVTDSGGNDVTLLNADGSPVQLTEVKDLSSQLDDLDKALNHVRTQESRIGVTTNRIQGAIDDRGKAVDDLKGYLSTVEDADIAEVSTNLIQQETALKAAFSVTMRLSQISILDYLH